MRTDQQYSLIIRLKRKFRSLHSIHLCLGIFLLMSHTLYAQMHNLRGSLHSAGQPVASANISLLKDSMIIAYTSSDPKGNFQIDIKQEIPHDQIYLQVRHLAINSIYIRLDSAITKELKIELRAKSKTIFTISCEPLSKSITQRNQKLFLY